MEEEKVDPKWEGEASAEIKGTTPQQVWDLLQDFGNVHKWFPNLETCYLLDDGNQFPAQTGLIRYCAFTQTTSSSGTDQTITWWAKEKLIMIDPIKRCLSYQILENNMGFKWYMGTMEVLPIHDDGKNGCKIKWSFVCEPVEEGWSYEVLVSFFDSTLKLIAKKMEELFHSSI
ncbi:lachrymatory-factor synthase [Ziziphus jujuba]|uniref:Lachrymatory-factor synthase n=2 Tax=Ziziphus jujuba TaxID=326968 RepID=A0A6P3ZBR5_ZIZJJ|nr:lachrymatory-factor synthase [Ziziphus jujuba]KAH7524161.1 hypothetical protein FEM48_Zijuj06G0089800 [Ziziphus jujuba var. spinosa]